MSKSIFEEAIKVVTYLQEQDLHLIDTTGTIYISNENIATLENLLIHSHKQEKLLELYKELAIVRGDMLYCYKVVDFIAYNSMEKKETQLEKEIKELENDK